MQEPLVMKTPLGWVAADGAWWTDEIYKTEAEARAAVHVREGEWMRDMSRSGLLAMLRSINSRAGDTEANHYDADTALIAYIDDPEITEAYDNIDKWYA